MKTTKKETKSQKIAYLEQGIVDALGRGEKEYAAILGNLLLDTHLGRYDHLCAQEAN